MAGEPTTATDRRNRTVILAAAAFFLLAMPPIQAAETTWTCWVIYFSVDKLFSHRIVIDTGQNTVSIDSDRRPVWMGAGLFGNDGENRGAAEKVFVDIRPNGIVAWGTRGAEAYLNSTSTLNTIDGHYRFDVSGQQIGRGVCKRQDAMS